MMQKSIMIKIGEAKKRKLSKENVMFFSEIGGIYKFVEIREICNMHHWLRGMDAPGRPCSLRSLNSVAE